MAAVSWSSIAGGLIMPAEFACMFLSGCSASPDAGRLNLPGEFASQLQSNSHGANNVGSSRTLRGVRTRRVRSRCVMCGEIHDELMSCACFRCGRRHQGDCPCCVMCGEIHDEFTSCACFRCGRRHQGDCPTVCRLCGGCHSASSRCRQSSGLLRLTARRRSLSVFSNERYDDEHVAAIRHYLGEMSVECPHCRAKRWVTEKLNCCHGGVVVVPWDVEVPTDLSDVILCSHVRQNIRSYNTVMAFASTGHKNKSIVGGTFVLGGRTYHRIGSLLPGHSLHVNEFVLCSHMFFRSWHRSFFFPNLDFGH